MASLAEIWRHPVKALSRERLDSVRLTPGACLPLDRHWAVTHGKSRFAGDWAQKANFLRGVTSPALMAVTAETDGETLTLHHPDLPDLAIRPDAGDDWPRLSDWLEPLWPADLPRPSGIVSAGRAMTDVPEPWVSLNSLATHAAVADRLALPDLSIHRWRGNLWIEGLEPWAEFDWVGRRVRIGDTVLHVRERITRCKATMANPVTGIRDAETLDALHSFGHQDFGVYAVVLSGGEIAPGAQVEVGP
ncbi:MOSC domain-containing protein [Rhodobacterales bacterium HKCCE2091]|nr:MOSC domain-containing protein [Rhodobacterales bacterium HKCCE2091]